MKTLTIGIYDLLRAGESKALPFGKKEFEKPIIVKGISGTISSFPRLHASLILATDNIPVSVAYPKNEKVLFIINSGSGGTANNSTPELDIETDKLYFYYWAHNMKLFFSSDFHGNITVYYSVKEN